MTGFKVPFGLKNGRLVGTDEVARGLACECNCPECGAALEAHKGTQMAHHFAHHIAGNCSYGLESALHLGAKQIIREERRFAVPALNAVARAFDKESGISRVARKALQSKLIEFDSVVEEVTMDGVVADIYAVFRERPVIIEIAVTHFCDEEKIGRLAALGIPAIELDLSKITPPITMAELRAYVVEQLGHKTWLFNPRQVELNNNATSEANVLLQQTLANEAPWALLKKNLDKKYKAWSCAEKLEYALLRLKISEASIPAYLDHKTRGDRAFTCPRKVWQTAIFAEFIHRKTPYLTVSLKFLAGWLVDGFDLTEPFPNAVKVALWDFLENLTTVGCLERVPRQEFLIQRNSISAINAVAKSIQHSHLVHDQNVERGRKQRIATAWKLSLEQELAWAKNWNEAFAQDAIAECKRVFGDHPAWQSLMTTLRPDVRSLYPGDFANRYAATAGLNPGQVLRALVLAGFVIELPF